jgi:hypothetical protein
VLPASKFQRARKCRRAWRQSRQRLLRLVLPRLAGCLTILPSLLGAQSYITGLVFLGQGAGYVPVPGARVETRRAGSSEVLGAVETDSLGHYFLNVPAGPIAVTVSHPRYYPRKDADRSGETRAECPGSGPCSRVDFEMLATGEVEVVVVDSLGLPVEDASVEVRRVDGRDRARTPAVRAAGGVLTAFGIRPGRYEASAAPVEARGMVYQAAAAAFDFRPGQDQVRVRLVMPSERLFRISGRILGLAGSARPMLIVLEPQRETMQDAGRGLRLGAPLDSGGHFAVNGVPRGSYSLKLVWERGSRLDLDGSRSRVLAKIRVDADRKGLLLTAPADVDLP